MNRFVMTRIIVETSIIEDGGVTSTEEAKAYALDGWKWGPYADWELHGYKIVDVQPYREDQDVDRIAETWLDTFKEVEE